MEAAVGPTYDQVPVNGDGHLQTGRQPDPHGNCKKCIIALALALALVFLALVVTVIVPAVQNSKSPSADLGPSVGPACPDVCPDGWIGYRGKCYYFSKGEGDWASSQNNCSALGASLAGIDTKQDKAFVVRHKGKYDHWIGLRRDLGQPWKWANGTEFNHSFLIGGGGDCAYLNDESWVSSLRCTSKRYWICTKPYIYTEVKRAHNKSI